GGVGGGGGRRGGARWGGGGEGGREGGAAGGLAARLKWGGRGRRRPACVLSAGSSVAHRSMANGQRGWNRHPAGGSSGLGTSPASVSASRALSKSIGSAAANSAFVYGCCGASAIASASPLSTILPRYITAIVWLMWATAARSWAMKRYDTPRRSCRSDKRFRICARMDTSSADTGSSSTTSFGSSASARAMAMR